MSGCGFEVDLGAVGHGDDAGAALMVKPPPELSPIKRIGCVVGPFGSTAEAVMPTVLPSAAPSTTVLAAASVSVGAAIVTSVTPIVKVCELVSVPSLA